MYFYGGNFRYTFLSADWISSPPDVVLPSFRPGPRVVIKCAGAVHHWSLLPGIPLQHFTHQPFDSGIVDVVRTAHGWRRTTQTFFFILLFLLIGNFRDRSCDEQLRLVVFGSAVASATPIACVRLFPGVDIETIHVRIFKGMAEYLLQIMILKWTEYRLLPWTSLVRF